MSVETEMKAVEEAVVTEAKKAETTIEAETKTVAGDVEKEVKKVSTEVKAEVKRTRVDITTEEKLFLRDAEAAFLRAQVEIRDFQARIKDCVTKSESATRVYTAKIDELVKKYAINKTEMMFDNLENAFKSALTNVSKL
jgi:hypothetical protein